tara:strand:+ start:1476 stop:1703 length:228 start_codon:yes stop_codon:yes gene_type:complete
VGNYIFFKFESLKLNKMKKQELSNLLKTWTEKELYTTMISYGRKIRDYKLNKNSNQYIRMHEMITLLDAEISSRK